MTIQTVCNIYSFNWYCVIWTLPLSQEIIFVLSGTRLCLGSVAPKIVQVQLSLSLDRREPNRGP